MHKQWPLYLAALVVLAVGTAVLVAAEAPPTTITLKELDCAGCAKKLATKLKAVPGVSEVKTSLETKTATVTPQQGKQPSPRVLWETTEKAGFEPVKLEGPSGSFKDKPQN